MDSVISNPTDSVVSNLRHKCAACFRQFKQKEHLIYHMNASYHSIHQPQCGVCKKYCKTFASVREHIAGPLAKADCCNIYAERGCNLCFKVFVNSASRDDHTLFCCQHGAITPDSITGNVSLVNNLYAYFSLGSYRNLEAEAVAIDFVMVQGEMGNMCARVCVIDEYEKLIFHSYVLPTSTVADYMYERTGLTEGHFGDATALEEVQAKIAQILQSGARLLVGHNVADVIRSLNIYYPDSMLRDTSEYLPLKKTNGGSCSLKYLALTFLGYDIQMGVHDPYENCVAAMRLYKRMHSQHHDPVQVAPNDVDYMSETASAAPDLDNSAACYNIYNCMAQEDLEKMTPDQLFKISKSKYQCWCLD